VAIMTDQGRDGSDDPRTADDGGARSPVAIGIDIGGTHLRAARVTADGDLHDRVRRQTPAQAPARLVEVLAEVVETFDGDLPVGIGMAGLVSLDGTVRYGPNIGIRNLPLARHLEDRIGRAVTVLNDASAAAFAEQRVGAASGYLDVVMFTLGTGVGGGVTRGGDLVLGRSGYAGETGHMIVAEGGRRCPCGNRGCIEAYASGTAIGAMARDRLLDGDEPSSLREHDRVDGRAVSDAAHAGDEVARDVLATAGHWLGTAAASVVNVLDPDIILVGGGAATRTAPWLLPAARHAMRERLLGADFREPPAVELAVLGDDAGTVGAGLYAAVESGSPPGSGDGAAHR
jgi:glucokinase